MLGSILQQTRISLLVSAVPKRPAGGAAMVRCSSGGSASTSGDEFKGFGTPPKKVSTGDALQSSLSDLSQREGRVAKTNNVILGASDSEEKWRELDQQVNGDYPQHRTFKAIGNGGEDFVFSMRTAVESVTGNRLHEECIATRLSAKQNYISVTIGPVWVENPDQVLAIYEAMRADTRLRFFF